MMDLSESKDDDTIEDIVDRLLADDTEPTEQEKEEWFKRTQWVELPLMPVPTSKPNKKGD